MKEIVNFLYIDMKNWCQGRIWWVQLPVLLWLAYVWIGCLGEPMYWSWISPLNLGIHELGHYVFMPFGRFLEIAGGTILQCLAPIVGFLMFYRQRDYFAMSFAIGWLAINFFNVATYVGDAQSMSLPLVTPGGGEPLHDWHYLLQRLGMLRHDRTLAFLLRLLASATMLVSLVAGTVVLAQMWLAPKAQSNTSGRKR